MDENNRQQLDAVTVLNAEIYRNGDQVVIHITEDKLRLILGDYESAIQERRSWIAPLSVFLTVLVAPTTGTANDLLLPQDWWLPLYGGGTVCAMVWLSTSLLKRKARPRTDIEAVINAVKNAQ